jgi:hypothetical protein
MVDEPGEREDEVKARVDAQLDHLLGPVPEMVATQEWRTPVEDGAEERIARESAAQWAAGAP